MKWRLSHRADPAAVALADRHYNRQKVGSPQFVPPGRCVVLTTDTNDAVWTTSWPFAQYVKHDWPGAWINSIFRNEGPYLSSELISAAVAATLYFWTPPDLTFPIVTFIDASKVRKKRDFGRCYLRAGWERIGITKGGLLAFGLRHDNLPNPIAPQGVQEQGSLFTTASAGSNA